MRQLTERRLGTLAKKLHEPPKQSVIAPATPAGRAEQHWAAALTYCNCYIGCFQGGDDAVTCLNQCGNPSAASQAVYNCAQQYCQTPCQIP